MIEKLLFRTWTTLTDNGGNLSEGLHKPLVQAANTCSGGTCVPLIPLILFAIAFVATFGTYHSQKRLFGKSDILVSLSVGSFLATVTSVLMSAIEGLIAPYVIFVCIGITVVFTLILFLNRER